MSSTSVKVSIVFIATFLCINLSAQELDKASPEEVGMSTERLNRLTAVCEDYIDTGELAGSVVMIARKGKIAYHKSFGQRDMESKSAMTDDVIFRIASQSKAIISVGVMMLQEEGKLIITEPVGNYIPAFKETTVAVSDTEKGNYNIVKSDRAITIRDLLTHTAGIGYGYGPAFDLWDEAGITGWYFADRDEQIQATINRLAKLPMDAQPGAQFVYGYSTDILGALIEVVSGQPLDDFIQEHILDPLGMTDTHFYLPADKKSRLATVYSMENDQLSRAPDPGHMVGQGAYVDGPRKNFSGGAGYLSTAMDYARFLQMMLNNGTFNGHRIISRKTVESMTTNHLGDIKFPWGEGSGFGLGFSIIDDIGDVGTLGSNGAYGWGGAYHSTYWVDPSEELVVVYMTNIIPAGDINDHNKLRALVYQAIID